MTKLKITEEELKSHDVIDECEKLFSKKLKDKDLEGLKEIFIQVSLEAREALDLVHNLFRRLTEKGIIEKEAFGETRLISALALKKELEKKK